MSPKKNTGNVVDFSALDKAEEAALIDSSVEKLMKVMGETARLPKYREASIGGEHKTLPFLVLML